MDRRPPRRESEPDVCPGCADDLASTLEDTLRPFVHRYHDLAYLGRIAALRAELEQGRRYVEVFLGRPPRARRIPSDGVPVALQLDSDAWDWEYVGQDLETRLTTLARLAAALEQP